MTEPPTAKRISWTNKFLCAFRGLRVGSLGQSSFFVHLPMACFVLAAAAQLRVTTVEWCLLVVCITIVLSAELMNAALETMARAITRRISSGHSRCPRHCGGRRVIDRLGISRRR